MGRFNIFIFRNPIASVIEIIKICFPLLSLFSVLSHISFLDGILKKSIFHVCLIFIHCFVRVAYDICYFDVNAIKIVYR